MIDAACLVFYTGGRNNHTQRHAARLIRSAIDRLLPIAEDYGVTLAIEPMQHACAGEWSVLTGIEETIDVLADYASDNLKLVYDTYHFPQQSVGDTLLADIVPFLAVVHLGDTAQSYSIDQERCLLGEGRLPLRETIATLVEAGYDGHFDVELTGSVIEATDYDALLRSSREFFADALASVGAMRR